MANAIQELLLKVTGDSRGGVQALGAINTELKKTQDEVKVLTKQLRDYGNAGDAIKKPLQDALQGATVKAEQLKVAVGQVRKELRQSGEDAKPLEVSLSKIASSATSLGTMLTASVTAPIAAAATAALKFDMDFEAAMTRVHTLSGIGKNEIAGMRQAILDLAPAVGIGPGELAKALLAITSTGLKGKEALEVLTVSAKASAVGLGDVENIGRAVTAVLSAYGTENITAARAAEVLFKTVKLGGAEATQLAPQLGRVIAIAAQMGVSFEEVGASIATFTRLGVGADIAVTGLRDVLTHLADPSEKARGALAEVGLTAAQLRDIIQKEGLAAALLLLMDRTHGNIEAISQMIGDVRGLALVLGTAGVNSAQAYGENLENIRRQTDELGGAMTETGETAEQKWKQLTATLQALAIQVGEELLPQFKLLIDNYLVPGVHTVEEWVSWWKQLPQPVREAGEVILALTAAGGPALLGLGMLARAIAAIQTLLFGANVAAATSLVGVLKAYPFLTIMAGGFAVGNNAMTRDVTPEEDERIRFAMAGLPPLPSPLPPIPGRPAVAGTPGSGFVEGVHFPFGIPDESSGSAWSPIGGGQKTKAQLDAIADAWREYRSVAVDTTSTVAAMDQRTVEGIKYDLARGQSKKNLALIYQGTTDAQIDAIDDLAKAEKKAHDEVRKVEASLTRSFSGVGLAADTGMGAWNLNRQVEYLQRRGAFGAASALQAGMKDTPSVRYLNPINGNAISSLGSYQLGGIGALIAGPAGASIDRPISASRTAMLSIADAVPQLLVQSMAGGGGLRGALSGSLSFAGSTAMSSLFGKAGTSGLLKGLGANSFMGNLLGSAMPIVGGLVGPLVSSIVGALKKPEWKKLGHDIGRDFGVSLSEEVLKSMEADSKKFGRATTTLLHLDEIITAAGGLTPQNLDFYQGKLHDVFSAIETHQLSIAQGAKVIDKNWQAFAAAATDADGRISDELKEIIRLNDHFGTKSKEIAAWRKGQGGDVLSGFASTFPGTALDSEQRLKDASSRALTAYTAAVATGTSPQDALAAIGPALEAITQAYQDLGLEIDDVGLKTLMLQSTVSRTAASAVAGVSGISREMVALDNLGLETADMFAVQQRTAADYYTQIQASVAAAGGTTKDALALMQDYLHKAADEAKALGVPLDENTQRLIDQSQEVGVWKEKSKPAFEEMTDAVGVLVKSIQDLVNELRGIPSDVHSNVTVTTTHEDDGWRETDDAAPAAHTGALVWAGNLRRFHRGEPRVRSIAGLASDELLAVLQNGEAVTRASAVSSLGHRVMAAVNSGDPAAVALAAAAQSAASTSQLMASGVMAPRSVLPQFAAETVRSPRSGDFSSPDASSTPSGPTTAVLEVDGHVLGSVMFSPTVLSGRNRQFFRTAVSQALDELRR